MMHEFWMQQALEEAKKAELVGEVPVGAVLVYQNELIAAGHNESILRHDPSAHAEIVVLRRAGEKCRNYRLPGSILYVTLEPCPMCTGALIHARIAEVVYGATDPKSGGCGSQISLHQHPALNHQLKISAGVLNAACQKLLKNFFKNKRS